jgi:hypothetical protein
MLSRIILSLGALALVFAGLLVLHFNIMDPLGTAQFVMKATGNNILVSVILLWGSIPLGMYILVRATSGRRPRRR